MGKDLSRRRIARIATSLVLAAAIIAGAYGTLAARWTSSTAGYVDVPEASGLIDGASSDVTVKESSDAPQAVVGGALVEESGR